MHSIAVCTLHTSPGLYFLHPVTLALGVFAFDDVPLLFGHAMVASHPLFGFFGLERLILPIDPHTGHALMVASTVHGLYLLNPIRSGILTLPILFLLFFGSFRVPFSLGGLARSWHIHALVLILGPHTRPPTHVTFERDEVSPEPGHDGPVAAAQFDHGVDDNIDGSVLVLGLRVWLDIGYRPTGLILGLWQSPLGSEVVWVVWAV